MSAGGQKGWAILCFAVCCLWAFGAWAQGFNLAQGSSEIEITSDDGMEWQSDGSRVVARGNARAVRGDLTVTADTLTAYYRTAADSANGSTTAKGAGGDKPGGAKSGGGGSQIWRIDADGKVVIFNLTDKATGNKAVYDLDKALLTLYGKPAILTTPTDIFTADDTLQYFEGEHKAVLTTNATASGKNKKIQSDLLTAYFKEQSQSQKAKKPGAKKAGDKSDGGNMDLSKAYALGHVILTTPQDKVTGDKGDYDADSGVATVTGSVVLTRADNILNGGFAHVDLNSGVSTLYGNAPQDDQARQRVRGIFKPAAKTGDSHKAADPAAEAGQ
jgi:lipopolysaccharide export system protein LptA